MTTRLGSAVVTLPSDTEIQIERSFEAPRWLVWTALTQPRHLLRWWGPSWCPMTACEVDLRPGGSWRYVCRMDDGAELAWHGTYRRIEPTVLIESTEVFEGFPDAAHDDAPDSTSRAYNALSLGTGYRYSMMEAVD